MERSFEATRQWGRNRGSKLPFVPFSHRDNELVGQQTVLGRAMHLILQHFAILLFVALVALYPGTASADDVSAEDVRKSIDNAISYLIEHQDDNGNWDNSASYKFGVTPLCTLALLNAGVKPDEPHVAKAIARVRKTPLDKMSTYSVSLRIMMLAAADPSGRMYLDDIERDVDWLLEAQIKGGPSLGGWDYGNRGQRMMASANTSTCQFALLGLHEASLLGVKIPAKHWDAAAKYWEKAFVKRGGGFAYSTRGDRATGSMTCAGISSVIIVDENRDNADKLIENGNVNCCGDVGESLLVQAAIDWLAKSFRVKGNPTGRRSADVGTKYYYLYALERAGRLSGRRFIGAHDWYREGAEHLVKVQGFGGNWTGTNSFGEGDPNIGTALALLFLAKGKRPIVIGKYEHGVDNDWDLHPKGIHQLTRNIEDQWNKKLNWQTINGSEATVNDLREAPVLFLSGRSRLNLNQQQKANLKKYVVSGGFIFAEACQGDGCGQNAAFDTKFRDLMAELFPDNELAPLKPDHPIWNAHFRLAPNSERPLLGLQACCRTSVVYCPANLSCFWQVDRPVLFNQLNKRAKETVAYCTELGVNVISYATGRELRDKLDVPKLDEVGEKQILGERVLVLPKLEHSGGSDEAPNAWRKVLSETSQAGLRVKLDKKMIKPTFEELADHPVVFMHGRDKFSFSKDQRKALREHLENKGMLFVDSICSSEAFTESFRREIKLILPDNAMEAIPSNHPLWNRKEFGGKIGNVTLQIRNEGAVGGFQKKMTPPLFEGISIDDQLSVVFSPYDLSCALENASVSQCEGYTHDDALAMARQVLFYYLQTD